MKKINSNIVLSIVSGVLALASLVFIIILSYNMVTQGVTALRIGALVGLCIAFAICVAMVGILITLNKIKRNPEQLINQDFQNKKIK